MVDLQHHASNIFSLRSRHHACKDESSAFQPCRRRYGTTPFYYDDVIKWKHLPCYFPFTSEISRTRSLMFASICFWTNGWANKQVASDLSRHVVHYDITVMITLVWHGWFLMFWNILILWIIFIVQTLSHWSLHLPLYNNCHLNFISIGVTLFCRC